MKLVTIDNQVLYALVYDSYEDKQFINNDSYVRWSLVPVAIYDYIDPDNSDVQGWLQEYPTIENIQSDGIVQYLFSESLEEALNQFAYSLIDVGEVYLKIYDNGEPDQFTGIRRISAEDAVYNAVEGLDTGTWFNGEEV